MPTSNTTVLKFTKATPHAFAPSKGSTKAAGYDLKSAEDYIVPARGKQIVNTGIKVQLPEGCYGRIAPRSGLAAKNCIDVGGTFIYRVLRMRQKKWVILAGVIDEDYRGVIKVILFNLSDADFAIKKGDRIAQLICERIYYPEIEEVQVFIKLFLVLLKKR